MAELRIAEEAMSLQVEQSYDLRAMFSHLGLQLSSIPPNSRQSDLLQLKEQIT